jgi:hypothetical protein
MLEDGEIERGREIGWWTIGEIGSATSEVGMSGFEEFYKIGEVSKGGGDTSGESKEEAAEEVAVGTKRVAFGWVVEQGSKNVVVGGMRKGTSTEALILESSCCMAWSFAGNELSSNTTFLER